MKCAAQPFTYGPVFPEILTNMRYTVSILVLMLIATVSFAQQSETRQLDSFKAIRTSEAIDVYLKKGDKESARVEVDGVKLIDVLTEVSGGYLQVHMRSGNYRGNRNVKVYVTYVQLEKISASSASEVFSENVIKSGTLKLTASSAGNIEIQAEASSITIDASSAGNITVEGKCKTLYAEAGSAGGIDAYNLEAENVNASASSGGHAKVNVTKSLSADASSGGSVRYRGNPQSTNTDSSSGGSVKKSS